MYLYTLTTETTPQQFFDAIKEGVKAGNFPSVKKTENYNERLKCLYRNEDRTKCCVVGMFIPEELYNENIEGFDVWGAFIDINLKLPQFLCCELLQLLQNTHDRLVNNWNDEVFLEDCKNLINSYIPDEVT